MIGNSYFIGLDYLVVHRLIIATILSSTNTILIRQRLQIYQILSWVGQGFPYGIHVLPCNHTVAVLNMK